MIMRTILATLAITVALVLIGGAGVVYSGVYDIGATAPHWGITHWVIETARVRSIKAHAAGIAAPPGLDDPARMTTSRIVRLRPMSTAIAARFATCLGLLRRGACRQGCKQIRRVEIILAGNADQGEQGVAASIGQGRAHAMRRCSLGNRADRPIRCDPFP